MEAEMRIKNYMEDFVGAMVKQYMPKMDVCQCDTCKLDITAIVLNSMPPKYVVSSAGEMYTKVNMLMLQFEVDAIAEIAKAAKIVNAFPRHGAEHNE